MFVAHQQHPARLRLGVLDRDRRAPRHRTRRAGPRRSSGSAPTRVARAGRRTRHPSATPTSPRGSRPIPSARSDPRSPPTARACRSCSRSSPRPSRCRCRRTRRPSRRAPGSRARTPPASRSTRPTATTRTPFHKPELIVALSDTFDALSRLPPARRGARHPRGAARGGCRGCRARARGARPARRAPRRRRSAARHRRVAAPDGRGGDTGEAAWVDRARRGARGRRCGRRSPYAPSFATVGALAEAYPGDPGIVISLLLNRVRLRRGEALYLPAGNIHAYLAGLGIELMAASDNVLRGGLTPKHIDVPELLDVLDFTPIDAAATRARGRRARRARVPARRARLRAVPGRAGGRGRRDARRRMPRACRSTGRPSCSPRAATCGSAERSARRRVARGERGLRHARRGRRRGRRRRRSPGSRRRACPRHPEPDRRRRRVPSTRQLAARSPNVRGTASAWSAAP